MKTQKERTKAQPRLATERLDTTVLRRTKDFASLRDEWDDLYNRCPRATPFQSWEWLYTWWELYGDAYRLRLITLRNPAGGRLVGLLPFMVGRGPRFGRLLLLGDNVVTSYTPYKDVLVREGWEEPVAQAAVRALKELDGWRVAELKELRPEATAWDIFRRWDAPKTSLPITDYILIRASSWDELLMSISSKARSSARRTLRRLKEDEVRLEPAAVEEADRAARNLVELHRDLWRGRDIDPEDLTPKYEAFVEAAARRMTARGIGRIYEFRRADGEVLVSRFLVFDKDFVGGFLIGASEEASRRYQFITLGIWTAMNVACSRENAYVSLMDYASWDKLRWASEVVSSQRAILGRKRTSFAPYAGYQTLRHKAICYVYSGSAPQWITKATDKCYALWYKYRLVRARREKHTNKTPQAETEIG